MDSIFYINNLTNLNTAMASMMKTIEEQAKIISQQAIELNELKEQLKGKKEQETDDDISDNEDTDSDYFGFDNYSIDDESVDFIDEEIVEDDDNISLGEDEIYDDGDITFVDNTKKEFFKKHDKKAEILKKTKSKKSNDEIKELIKDNKEINNVKCEKKSLFFDAKNLLF